MTTFVYPLWVCSRVKTWMFMCLIARFVAQEVFSISLANLLSRSQFQSDSFLLISIVLLLYNLVGRNSLQSFLFVCHLVSSRQSSQHFFPCCRPMTEWLILHGARYLGMNWLELFFKFMSRFILWLTVIFYRSNNEIVVHPEYLSTMKWILCALWLGK